MNATARPKGTAILATLGPATESVERIRALAEAGVDAFRINFSHGDREQRERGASETGGRGSTGTGSPRAQIQ